MANTDDNQNWLRKASPPEEYFYHGHLKKLNTVSYAITLHTSSTELPSVMKRALILLYRKVPVLRVCFGKRDGELWLREMKECKIEYEVLKDVKLEEEQKKMIRIFDTSQGPLWRVALLSEEDAMEALNDIEGPFAESHCYYVLLCLHHGISDGITNVKICGWLRMILDDLLSGRPVDPDTQLGDHVSYDAAMKLYAEEEERFRGDPAALEQAMLQFSEEEKTRPLLLDALPRVQPHEEVTVKDIPLHFDENQTRLLIKKCKAVRVTLNSFFTCALNLTLLDFLRENLPAEKREEVYHFRAGHDVSLRRYYEGDTSRAIGVHLPTFGFRLDCQTPVNLHKEFWAQTKEFNEKFQSAISNREPIRTVVLREMQQARTDIIEDFNSDSGVPNYYYTISNLGDVDKMLSTGGDCVQIMRLSQYFLLRHKRHFMCFQIHTFRGQLTINMLYSTHYFSEGYALRFADLLYTTVLSRLEP